MQPTAVSPDNHEHGVAGTVATGSDGAKEEFEIGELKDDERQDEEGLDVPACHPVESSEVVDQDDADGEGEGDGDAEEEHATPVGLRDPS